MTRELRLALALCLAGAVLLLVVGGRTWVTVEGAQPAPLPSTSTPLSGADLVPGLRALALAGLAGAGALLAARPRWRPLVGLLLALLGAGAGAAVLGVRSDPGSALRDATGGGTDFAADGAAFGAWPLIALAGAALLVAAGLLVLARGRRGAGLAARYDAPASREVPTATSAWDDLDRGVDPTGDAADDPTAGPRTSVRGSTPAQEETP